MSDWEREQGQHSHPRTFIELHVHPDKIVPTLLHEVISHLHQIIERLEHMATQEEVDAIGAAISAVSDKLDLEAGELTAAKDAIIAEIAALQQANPMLDLTGLTAASDRLTASAGNIGAMADAVEAIPVPPVV